MYLIIEVTGLEAKTGELPALEDLVVALLLLLPVPAADRVR